MINLGNEGIAAARALRLDPNFAAVRAALRLEAQSFADKSLGVAVENRIEATAYARALRDVVIAIEAAMLQVHHLMVPPAPNLVLEKQIKTAAGKLPKEKATPVVASPDPAAAAITDILA